MRRALIAAAGLVTLTACSSSHPSTSPSTTSASPSSPTATTPFTIVTSTTSPSSSSSVASTSSVPSGPQPCPTASLAASLTSPNGAAGTIYYTLVFTNQGNAQCTLSGYPGVSFVTDPGGQQVGAPASRTPGSVTVVTLPSGGSADATLGIGAAGNFANCQVTPVQALRVFPPGQTVALVVPHSDTACANSNDVTLRVGPVAAAS